MNICGELFVYGTLKKDQLRGSLWPRQPICIREAIVQGTLWDLGHYPGLTHGLDWCLGELWSIAAEDLEETLAVLDEIEGYCKESDTGLYVRRMIRAKVRSSCPQEEWETVDAQTYMFEQSSKVTSKRIIRPWVRSPVLTEQDLKVASWPDELSRVPKRLEEEQDH
jgi:gamma-glutamylcyclotransferase (GGCT)/AIG2-like uncharacterized protein YtfP